MPLYLQCCFIYNAVLFFFLLPHLICAHCGRVLTNSHQILVKSSDTGLLTALNPYVGDTEGKKSDQVQGQNPKIQHKEPQPVSAHHIGGGAEYFFRVHSGKIKQQVIGHGKGERPDGVCDETDQGYARSNRKIRQ